MTSLLQGKPAASTTVVQESTGRTGACTIMDQRTLYTKSWWLAHAVLLLNHTGAVHYWKLSLIGTFWCPRMLALVTAAAKATLAVVTLTTPGLVIRHQTTCFSFPEYIVPLFILLHDRCEQLLPSLLVSHGKTAPQELKKQISNNDIMKDEYGDIVCSEDPSNDLLLKIVEFFVKSKQKV